MDLKGKKILVTGASSGIGQAIAVACARKGAIILVNYRGNKSGAEQTLQEVRRHSQGFVFQADLTDEERVRRMFADIAGAVGTIDIVVNNAGDARPGGFFDNDRWRNQFESIFFSALRVSQYFLKHATESPLRKIVNISSCYGNVGCGDTGYIAYSVAKAALSSMTVELAKMDARVLVNAIAPGYTWTPPWERETSEAEKREYESRALIGRFIAADEVAHMVVAVLENDAMTGEVVTIDGGLSLRRF
ncbi:MAG: SDR family oxidoreductase [Candidatus Colwellbacteria bacterium]|nr:SDR family oxidoreductase [Candidatus Colwellbacteria bacterium]